MSSFAVYLEKVTRGLTPFHLLPVTGGRIEQTMDKGKALERASFFMESQSRHGTNLKDVLESRHLYRLRYGDMCGHR